VCGQPPVLAARRGDCSCNLQHVSHTPPMSHMPSRTFAPVLCHGASASPHVSTFLRFTLALIHNSATVHCSSQAHAVSTALGVLCSNTCARSLQVATGRFFTALLFPRLLRMKQLSRYSLHRLCGFTLHTVAGFAGWRGLRERFCRRCDSQMSRTPCNQDEKKKTARCPHAQQYWGFPCALTISYT
jgi:hypothetical protein